MRLGLAAAASVALIDQFAKAWVLGLFAAEAVARPVAVAPFLNLALTMNRGMSFGLFNTDAALNAIIFTIIAAIIVAALLVWLARTHEAMLAIAIGLVIGGAVGNVYDRLLRGAVVDFLDFHIGELHWFVFNLADAAISVGVGLMVIDGLRGRREAPN
ncbi:MAG TPA: signal peptidase II [Stellaceae bacterium]|nr:signal peptidase II [Stellaceae bacterium]